VADTVAVMAAVTLPTLAGMVRVATSEVDIAAAVAFSLVMAAVEPKPSKQRSLSGRCFGAALDPIRKSTRLRETC
jgi:hypothetical protein